MDMTQKRWFRSRASTVSLSALTIAGAIAASIATGAPALASEECTHQEFTHEHGEYIMVTVDDGFCPAAGWPNFDSTAFGDRQAAVTAAREEAAGWPNFDPSDMSDEVAATEAREEAATWPDFDPSDMSDEVAATEARKITAGWPNYDSTNIDTDPDTVANSPRMTQIAASQAASGDTAAAGSTDDSYPFVTGSDEDTLIVQPETVARTNPFVL
jgi:hypothetical protein